MHSTTKRRLASPVIALVALATFAGVASAAPTTTLTTFGDGEVITTGTSATIANEPGQYGGVYLKSKSQSNKLLKDVDFSFKSTGDTAGGAPRFSIPLNTGSGTTPYAFLDVNNCGNTLGLVSTNEPTCMVSVGDESFANWNELATEHPAWRIASGKIPFVIADQPGEYAVENIVLR